MLWPMLCYMLNVSNGAYKLKGNTMRFNKGFVVAMVIYCLGFFVAMAYVVSVLGL